MASTWHPHGIHMASTWHPRGIHMAPTWHPRGIYVASTWHPHGIHVAFYLTHQYQVTVRSLILHFKISFDQIKLVCGWKSHYSTSSACV